MFRSRYPTLESAKVKRRREIYAKASHALERAEHRRVSFNRAVFNALCYLAEEPALHICMDDWQNLTGHDDCFGVVSTDAVIYAKRKMGELEKLIEGVS